MILGIITRPRGMRSPFNLLPALDFYFKGSIHLNEVAQTPINYVFILSLLNMRFTFNMPPQTQDGNSIFCLSLMDYDVQIM